MTSVHPEESKGPIQTPAKAEESKSKREAGQTPVPAEVTEVRDALIANLGDDLTALFWQGSWARGEQTRESDHDMVVILRRADDDILDRLQAVFAGRPGWSTYVKTEQELRQYPAGGRIQFHYGIVPLYGAIEPPPLIREGIIDDLRRFVVDLNHETRYRLLHGRKHYDNHDDAAFGRVRNARILYYFTKIAILAMKARHLLTTGSYPSTRADLRAVTTDPLELEIIDVVDRWADRKPQYEADFTPLARLLDAYARSLVAWLAEAYPLVKRHFTATGFVVRGDATLLHWHRRLQQWMPPGGHIEPDEDPVQAVLREIREETGVVAEVISTSEHLPFSYPDQLPAPYTILVEDIPGPDEPHKHIDLIYFCRALANATHAIVDDPTLRWVTEAELRANEPLDVAGCGVTAAVPEDVRQLAVVAIAAVRHHSEG